MKSKKILTILAALSVFAITPVSAQNDGISIKLGERLYNRTCIWCHGEEGKGDGDVTRFENNTIKPKALVKTILSEEQVYLFAKHGGQYWGAANNDMPDWGDQFSDSELKSIAHYIVQKFRHMPPSK